MVPHHRRRYLVFHVVEPADIGKGLLIHLIRGRTRKLTEEEFQRIRPWFVYFHSGWAIIRTWHRGVDDLVEIIKEIDGTELKEGMLRINIAGVSGTLKAAFNKYVPEPVRESSHYRVHRER